MPTLPKGRKGKVVELRDERRGGDYETNVAMVQIGDLEAVAVTVPAGSVKLGDAVDVPGGGATTEGP